MNNTEDVKWDLGFEGYKSAGYMSMAAAEEAPIRCTSHSYDD